MKSMFWRSPPVESPTCSPSAEAPSPRAGRPRPPCWFELAIHALERCFRRATAQAQWDSSANR